MLSRCSIRSGRLISQHYTRSRSHGTHRSAVRCKTSTSEKDTSTSTSEQNPQGTEKKEAPKWLTKMAPTKGGTALPTPKEAAVIAVVMAAGYYAWFVDGPKKEGNMVC